MSIALLQLHDVQGSVTHKTLRILIVDNVADSAEALEILLSCEGHTVSVAYGAAKAIQMLNSFQPELAILDLGIPDPGGYAVARALQCSSEGLCIPVIGLSIKSDIDSRNKAAAAGITHYLVKPLNPRRFLTLINGLAGAG